MQSFLLHGHEAFRLGDTGGSGTPAARRIASKTSPAQLGAPPAKKPTTSPPPPFGHKVVEKALPKASKRLLACITSMHTHLHFVHFMVTPL